MSDISKQETPSPDLVFDFGVVIPHLDHSKHLLACLRSVLMQEGSFTAHIHIQDGGTDDTVEQYVEECSKWLDSKRFSLTSIQETDTGAAQAINRGMAHLNAKMVTWLGADDMLMPGSFEAIGSLVDQHPEIQWVTGLPHIVSETGIPVPNYGAAGFYRFPTGFSREALMRGLHAGEINHGFLQQEGTFWSKNLWLQTGGLDEKLRLSFDFDLWCRFAEHSELVELVAPLGAFRKRPGQASEDLAGYLNETNDLRKKYLSRHGAPRVGVEKTSVAFLDSRTYRWKIGRRGFLVVRQPYSLRIPVYASLLMSSAVAARLRVRSGSSRSARNAVRILGKLRRSLGF